MLNRMSLKSMAEAVRAGRVTPRELVDAHIAQIEKTESDLNAFIEVYAAEAREIAGRISHGGLLAGVPVTVKDSFDIAGRVTACGSRLRRGATAAEDSTAVRRLRAAGAIILGKTACPEFLMNYETESWLKPATRNPANLQRTAGGSSGGEAAAIAAFCSAGGVGSDGGGSIREPAGFCGIVGLKPTPGRVSAAGHWPEIAHPGGLLGVAGPMARTVADTRLLFEALAGHDPRDPFSVPMPPAAPAGEAPLIAVLDGFPMTPGVRASLERAAAACAGAGWRVERAPRGLLDNAHELWRFLFISVNAPLLRSYIAGREAECHWTGLELINMVANEQPPAAAELCGILMERDRLRGRVCEWLEARNAVLLAPVCGRTAWTPGDRSFDLLEAVRPLTFANLLGLPALAVPAGRDEEGLARRRAVRRRAVARGNPA
jgi:amidase